MSEQTKRLQGVLARKYLGKQGIHGISIDEDNGTVNVYVDPVHDATRTVDRLRKDAGELKVQTIASPRARLA